ncbi:hypothetical protein CHL76_14200 [Marinococcus halophilus]|uniref:Uncharacterized protein n=1 Tax=Marinococcus halophilus TaxID=1371 RepID=A0A510Y904_MARHA|nr:hypothetical protein [Marinococcus halophilus]OZT79191.1 hypothetical protein CHL76_14200 [Marinococcus halophilus]GEK59854.1 hypothetical protein MHA01_27590 [Marinococcus halophilus]
MKMLTTTILSLLFASAVWATLETPADAANVAIVGGGSLGYQPIIQKQTQNGQHILRTESYISEDQRRPCGTSECRTIFQQYHERMNEIFNHTNHVLTFDSFEQSLVYQLSNGDYFIVSNYTNEVTGDYRHIEVILHQSLNYMQDMYIDNEASSSYDSPMVPGENRWVRNTGQRDE